MTALYALEHKNAVCAAVASVTCNLMWTTLRDDVRNAENYSR
jgi:hypothetical protein